MNGDDQEGKIINIHNQEDQQLIPNEFYGLASKRIILGRSVAIPKSSVLVVLCHLGENKAKSEDFDKTVLAQSQSPNGDVAVTTVNLSQMPCRCGDNSTGGCTTKGSPVFWSSWLSTGQDPQNPVAPESSQTYTRWFLIYLHHYSIL